MTDTSLQAQVDAQLLEQGSFAPLELLFNSGRLLYSDYEAWRRRELEFLDGALMGNSDKIKAELEQAIGYAKRIGLVEQSQEFLPWHTDAVPSLAAGSADRAPASTASLMTAPGNDAAKQRTGRADQPLRISMDPKLQRLIGSRYLRAQNLPQMDLFFDNPIVALTNGIVQSLTTRNLPNAQRQLDQLYAQAPTHADLAAFDQLLAALGHLGHPIAAPRDELTFLIELTPTARRLLGAQSRDLLSPLWQQLATALADVAFNPEDPDLHRSFALCQAQDWPAVSDCVTREPHWQSHAPLCLRVVEAAFHRRRRVEALAAWCHVCWRAPTSASASSASPSSASSSSASASNASASSASASSASPSSISASSISDFVSRLRQPELTSLWSRFLDEQDPLPEADFPSWLLIQEPALVLQLAEDLATTGTLAEVTYRTVHRCLTARRSRRTSDELTERKTLQTTNPTLFQLLKTSA